MIKIKLKELAKRLGKSISDVAEDTGLNRNSVSALYNGKVDGIKFDTIIRLHKAYKIKLDDILEMDFKEERDDKEELLYMQEGAMVPINGWIPFLSVNEMPYEYFGKDAGRCYVYLKKGYGYYFWNWASMNRVADYIYNRYSNPNQLEKLYKIFYGHARNLENHYYTCSQELVNSMDDQELSAYFNQVLAALSKFWSYGIFIDCYDAGYDFQKIDEITKKYKFSQDEVIALTTPKEMTYNNERLLVILGMVKAIKKKKILKSKIDAFLENYVEFDPGVKKYIKDYDYYKSNYAHVDHITSKEVVAEIKKYLKDEKLFEEEYQKLSRHTQVHEKKIKKILVAHKLKVNPLYFFAKLTYWREYRKKDNLMTFTIIDNILNTLEIRTGIPKKYLHQLSHEEFDNTLKGLVGPEILKKRMDLGIAIILENKNYKMLIGAEAASLREELEQKLKTKKEENQTIIPGQSACRGYAKGVAKLVWGKDDFSKVKDGDILVTGMTRPEFLPIMKKAAGIVTNEGGVTCHAAIVSRELGKPCVIGTKVAMQVIKDGDLVEVRANHGTVRILK